MVKEICHILLNATSRYNTLDMIIFGFNKSVLVEGPLCTTELIWITAVKVECKSHYTYKCKTTLNLRRTFISIQ